MSHVGRLVLGTLLAILSVIVVGLLMSGYSVSDLTRALPIPLPQNCTVGLTGAAVSVTVQGPTAQSQCNSFLGTKTDGGSWYNYAGGQSAGGAVICQENYSGDLFTVRDQGSLNLYGSGVCSNLIKLINAALAPPVVTQAPYVAPPSTPAPVGGDGSSFVFDPSSSDSLNFQEHQYLYTFIKPCPRAGCETASPDPRFAWMSDWEAPIPAEFQPCLANMNSDACSRAIAGP